MREIARIGTDAEQQAVRRVHVDGYFQFIRERGDDLAGRGALLHIAVIPETGIGNVVVDVEFDFFRFGKRFAQRTEARLVARIHRDERLRVLGGCGRDFAHSLQKEKFCGNRAFAHHFGRNPARAQKALQPQCRAERVAVGTHMTENRRAFNGFQFICNFT